MLEIEITPGMKDKAMEGDYYGGSKENHEAYYKAMSDLETLMRAHEVLVDEERMSMALELAKEQKSALEGVFGDLMAVAVNGQRDGERRARRQGSERQNGRNPGLRQMLERAMDDTEDEGEAT